MKRASWSRLTRPAMVLIVGFGLLLTSACAQIPSPQGDIATDSGVPVYDYSFDNPWAATVLGTPQAQQVQFGERVEPVRREIEIFEQRDIPEGFWYQRRLRYSVLLQPAPAPLVFVVAGTGADDQAPHMLTLGQTLYQAGLHVVLLPSPTHPNFIISASGSMLPGRPDADAADLYRVMRLVDARLRDRQRITGYQLTGYSLGAWHAAFVAKLDGEQDAFQFQRILLINPPLSLYRSVQAIDAMLVRNLPGGISGLDAFLDEAIVRLASTFSGTDALNFQDPDFTIDAYQRLRPSDGRLAAAIGLSFRLSAANLTFTADVMRGGGYIFPEDQPFRSTTPLSAYLAVALRTSLLDYFNDIYAGYYLAEHPALTKGDLLEQTSLSAIGTWLSANDRVWLMTNEDDVILAPGDLDVLRHIFGQRSRIFPNGGHMGNLEHRAVATFISDFFLQ